ncbi:hypothetical protein BJ165DRAFT_1530063 [Panaeolus papilionaceus]|nr:hypothetical protein BJ165DRAFT_1530063 [Panaeolus papilionaceus]
MPDKKWSRLDWAMDFESLTVHALIIVDAISIIFPYTSHPSADRIQRKQFVCSSEHHVAQLVHKSSPPMSQNDFLAGIKLNLIGTYANLMIYSLELFGLYFYCRSERSKRDWKAFHAVLAASIVSDTLGTMVQCGMAYLNITVLASSGGTFPKAWIKFFLIWIATNMISAFNFQSFMCYRYLRLSGNRIVSGFIILCILTSVRSFILSQGSMKVRWISAQMAATLRALAFGDSLLTTIFIPDRVESSSAKYILIVLATAMATDVLITGALVHHLYRTKGKQAAAHTNRLISRLHIHFIKTGSIPCLFATTILVLYIACSNAGVSVAFALCLGRVYTSTMLFTLLFRSRVAQDRTLRPSVINFSRTETTPTSIALPEVTSSPIIYAQPPDKTRFDSEHPDQV